MTDARIVFFVFAGREANMELQWPYIERLLEMYPNMEYHVWDLTRNVEDHNYLDGRFSNIHPRVKVFDHLWQGPNENEVCLKRQRRPRSCACWECRPAPFEEVYAWYANASIRFIEQGDAVAADQGVSPYADVTFVKLDDDIVFIETERFDEILALLAERPNAVVSANVVNNVVSAKHDEDLRPIVEKTYRPHTFKAWFDLHADVNFGLLSHKWFLGHYRELLDPDRPVEIDRCLPGEKPSINFIAMTYPTLCRVNRTVQEWHTRLGDEGAINHNFLPWITLSFRVAHLYFGPQRVGMDKEIDGLRQDYATLSKEYLS